MMKQANCTICTKQITIADDVEPICSMACKRRWVKRQFNEMDDSEAWCPSCGKGGFHSVRTAVRHHNDIHTFEVRRTHDCEECGSEFVPKNWSNDNKFCSLDCFEASDTYCGNEPPFVQEK